MSNYDINSPIPEDVKQVGKEIKKEVKESSQDWVCYIQKHPIQTITLGLACIGLGVLINGLWPSSK